MSKEITDEQINERLEKLGFGDKQASNEEVARQNVLDYYHVVLHDDFKDSDFHMYEETTADGYEVWVVTHDMDRVNVSENVYYYDSDLAKELAENIKWSNGDEGYPHTIFVSDLDCGFVEEAMESLFVELSEKFYDEVVAQLEDEGYEYK